MSVCSKAVYPAEFCHPDGGNTLEARAGFRTFFTGTDEFPLSRRNDESVYHEGVANNHRSRGIQVKKALKKGMSIALIAALAVTAVACSGGSGGRGGGNSSGNAPAENAVNTEPVPSAVSGEKP